MYLGLLRDSRLFGVLLKVDEDLAEQARRARCRCGGILHRATYERKPRGGPEGLSRSHAMRLSFCCARDGCRRRTTPVSLRFLGRKVFFGIAVLLGPVLTGAVRGAERRRVLEVVGASARTLRRWARWWREVFAGGPFWSTVQGRFARPVAVAEMPASLLAVWAHLSPADAVSSALLFVAPGAAPVRAV